MAQQRLLLGICSAVVLASLAICIKTYVADGNGLVRSSGYLFAVLVALSALATAWAAVAIVRSWRTGGGLRIASAATALSWLTIVVLIVAHDFKT